MNTFYKYFLPLIFLGISLSQCSAQTTTTLGGIRTGTNGLITATTSFWHGSITGSDYRVPMSELAKAVLSNLTISNGGSTLFTLTGINATPTTTLGVLTLTQTTTGVLTLSNLGVGSISATDAAAIHLNTTLSGREGLRIVSQTGQTANLLTVRSITTGTDYIYVTGAGILAIRNGVGQLQQWGDPGSTRIVIQSTSGTPAYMNFGGGYGIGFNSSSNAGGQDGSTVCVSSLTANTLRVTNTSGTANNIAVGAIATGYRATASSSAMTLTDGIINITASGITVTLADSTSLTGRQSIILNSSAGTSTVAGLTATQTINGATTLSISANSSLRIISTGTINISY